MATINTRGGTQPFKISHGGALSRVKAIISLSERDDAPAQSSPTIFITENYRFGTQDVLDLSRAIHVFQQAGGREVVEAFNRPEGILLAPDSTPASGTTRLPSAPTTSQGPLATASLPYVPRAIKLYGTQETMARLTSAFVEAARWLRKEDPTCNHGRVLELVQNKEEYLVACAKSVSRPRRVDGTRRLTIHLSFRAIVPESSKSRSRPHDTTHPFLLRRETNNSNRHPLPRAHRPNYHRHLPRNLHPSVSPTPAQHAGVLLDGGDGDRVGCVCVLGGAWVGHGAACVEV
jgi:hypothetical protein